MKIFNEPRKSSRNKNVMFCLYLSKYLYLTVGEKNVYIAQLTLLTTTCNLRRGKTKIFFIFLKPNLREMSLIEKTDIMSIERNITVMDWCRTSA